MSLLRAAHSGGRRAPTERAACLRTSTPSVARGRISAIGGSQDEPGEGQWPEFAEALRVPWSVVDMKQDWKTVFPPQEKAQ
jgi:hypothetical protein